MKNRAIIYEVKCMEHIIDSIKNAIELAKQKDCKVKFKHNDMNIEVDKYDDSHYIYAQWYMDASKTGKQI